MRTQISIYQKRQWLYDAIDAGVPARDLKRELNHVNKQIKKLES